MTLVVDAHHHFLDPARHEYYWMNDDIAILRRHYGPEDLRPLLAPNGVDWTIVVQTIPSVDETRDFLQIAADTEFVAGVIGWMDLTDSSAAKTLAQIRAAPGGNYLVGIRHQAHDEKDGTWLMRKNVMRGIKAVGDAGLVYELLVRTRELPAALEVVSRLPEVRFVIDHIAKPRIAAGPVDPDWELAMAPLSHYPNVMCKLSGMVTEASLTAWKPDDLVPYIRKVLGWFGPDRCIFGTDWPVCLLAATYGQVVDALRYAISDLKPAEQEAILGGNAIREYGLPV